MPKPNPKQVAEFIAHLQEAMCRRQEAAEARHRTHRRAHVAALLCRVGGAARRARWASARTLSCAVCRPRAGEARLEVSDNAREYSADAARLQLASVCVLDMQPWSGPRRGATVGGVRAVGAPASGVRCAFGDEAAAGGAAAGWRGVGASAASAGAAASGVRCVSPASAVTGWVGV